MAAPAVSLVRDFTGVPAPFGPGHPESGAAPEAHADIDFAKPDFGYNKRQHVKSR
jgi:hypothetical protein